MRRKGVPMRQHRKERRVVLVDNVVKFYRECPWDDWWDEFVSAQDKHGNLLYKTALEFATIKAGGHKDRTRLIYMCIGPKPVRVTVEGHISERLPVRWLGDWLGRRAGFFYYSDARLEALKKHMDKTADSLDIARAAAQYPMKWIARAEHWSEQVSEIFQNRILVPGLGVKEQKRRADLFLSMQERLFELQGKALRQFMQYHGVDTADEVSRLAQMAAVGAKAALQGVAEGKKGAEEHPMLKLMMKTLAEKAQVYGLKLPEKPIITVDAVGGTDAEQSGSDAEQA